MNYEDTSPPSGIDLEIALDFILLRWKKYLFLAVAGIALGLFLQRTFPIFSASGSVYISDKDSSPLSAALGEMASLSGSLALGKKGTASLYRSILSTDSAYLKLAKRITESRGYALEKPYFDAEFAAYLAKARTQGVGLLSYDEWFARYCQKKILFFEEETNVLGVRTEGRTRLFTQESARIALQFAIDHSLANDKQSLELAENHLAGTLQTIEENIGALVKEMVEVKASVLASGNFLGASVLPTDALNIRTQIDMAAIELGQNRLILKKFLAAHRTDAAGSKVFYDQVSNANEILLAKIRQLKDLLSAKQNSKVQELGSMSRLETMARRMDIYSDSVKKLKEQSLKIEILSRSASSRFQVSKMALPDVVKPVVGGTVAGLVTAALILFAVFLADLIGLALRPRVTGYKSLAGIHSKFVALLPHVSGREAAGISDTKTRKTPDLSRVSEGVKGLKKLHRNIRNEFATTEAGHRRGRVVVTSSPTAACGKSTISSSLAWSIAASGARCILIDLDPYHPQTSARFNLSGQSGLLNLLTSNAAIDDAAVQDAIFRYSDGSSAAEPKYLDILPVGTASDPSTPNARMEERFRRVLASLANSYDYILVDTPPLLDSFELHFAYEAADLLLMVAAFNFTTVNQLREAFDALTGDAQQKTALIINRVKGSSLSQSVKVSKSAKNYYNSTFQTLSIDPAKNGKKSA